ncbi:DUF6779 domain-containing protein [Corynebacterium sp.]|uniref:DUF6779 domain-containing protein n=1 Tax=Corynebacterium sp. TaxID=1720 RepID=UPI0026493A51|nr:DUF6779 domain-containing protein [Corynebacterium sp.]MDN5720540.1 hypothetical protein [Corynebacterium sp.]
MSSAYSPDDSHRLPDPSSRSGSSTPGNGLKLLMYLVFVLALAATIIMFFVDSERWLNIAVITSLWAAFFGAILVSRYSGIIGEERSRRQEQERRHKAELDRERSESQRREVQLENDYRNRLGSEHDKTLDAIRKELEAMREQLSDLSGGAWDGEQVSLKARAERIIELERNVSRAGETGGHPGAHERAESAAPAQSAQAGAPAQKNAEKGAQKSAPQGGQNRSGGRRGGFSTGTFAAVRWSGADSEDTTQIPMVVDTRSMEPTGGTSETEAEQGQKSSEATPAAESRPRWSEQQDTPAPSAESAAEPAAEPAQPAQPEQRAEATPVAEEPAAAPSQGQSQGRRRRAEEAEVHGRRRADESDQGVTVAELMAQMKKNAR